MAMAGSGLIVLVAQWRITEKNKSLIETQKVKAELAFLKSQISPHFLFNTLNNIYALAIAKSENTASGILWLSNMMRYITDKSEEDYVPVERGSKAWVTCPGVRNSRPNGRVIPNATRWGPPCWVKAPALREGPM